MPQHHGRMFLLAVLVLALRQHTALAFVAGSGASTLKTIPARSVSTVSKKCSGEIGAVERRRTGTMLCSMSTSTSKADDLRVLLGKGEILVMPCCYDGLTARLVEDAGFPLTFMTGFGVSGAHGLPDTQVRLLSSPVNNLPIGSNVTSHSVFAVY